MEEQLISFETAKLAKEKGFDYYSESLYCSVYLDNYELYNDMCVPLQHEKLEQYKAPTQSLLQKWLREVHNIIVYVKKDFDSLSEYFEMDIVKNNESFTEFEHFGSWEIALEKGLQKALNLI